MGQIASFFCLDEKSFQLLSANPAEVKPYEMASATEGFNKSFEGLRYVLRKGKDPKTILLIEQLFDPIRFVGEEIDYEQVDWENVPDDFNPSGTAVYYHDPTTVKAIAEFLKTVTDEAFISAFDPDELNRQKIYPYGVWNRKTGKDYAYNEQHMLEELHHLKQFFGEISKGENYCVCHVG